MARNVEKTKTDKIVIFFIPLCLVEHGEIKSQVMKPSLLFPKAFFENGRSSGLPQLTAAFPSLPRKLSG
jgi:hypothetical protein